MNELIMMVEKAPEGGYIAVPWELQSSPRQIPLTSCANRSGTQCAATTRKGRPQRSSDCNSSAKGSSRCEAAP